MRLPGTCESGTQRKLLSQLNNGVQVLVAALVQVAKTLVALLHQVTDFP